MTGDEGFVNEELGFDIENVDIPLVGDAVLDNVDGAPVEGQKSSSNAVDQGAQAQVPGGQDDAFTVQDIYFISDALINLPSVVWSRLPERDQSQVKTFNDQFYKYCIKKGIDPWEYFFDEFGLVMAVIPILKSYKDDYVELYKNPGKEEVKHGLDKDHDNYMKVEAEKDELRVVEDQREADQNIEMEVKNNG